MSARYIFRMDDITPAMDWGRFWSLLSLLMNHNIKPLLGIVPDNRDQSLNTQSAHPQFWEVMRHLQNTDAVDMAQHGYQHIMTYRPGAAMLGPSYGIKEMSEFAGDSYEEQLRKIQHGNTLLREQGITTTFWMAPNHSYDRGTLRALRESNFTAITDGIALFPYVCEELIFVPQQTWQPRWMPLGVQTICLHSNSITPAEIKRLRIFLRRPYNFSRFSHEVERAGTNPIRLFFDLAFRVTYQGAYQLKRRRAQTRQPHAGKRSLGTHPQPA